MVLRRARGFAPSPVTIDYKNREENEKGNLIALGGHLKNSVAVQVGQNVFISQHIGDLSTDSAFRTFKRTAEDLTGLYDLSVSTVCCDDHPEYLSTKYALDAYKNIKQIQHHFAHIAACRAETADRKDSCGS